MPVTLILLVSQCFWRWCVDCLQSINSDKLSKFVNAINGNEGTGYETLRCCSLHFTDCYIPGAFVLLFFYVWIHFSSIIKSRHLTFFGHLARMDVNASSNLLQRTGVDHRGSHAQPGWRTLMMTCLLWILGYMRLEIWCKIGLSGDRCCCTALHTCYTCMLLLDWIGSCFMTVFKGSPCICVVCADFTSWLSLTVRPLSVLCLTTVITGPCVYWLYLLVHHVSVERVYWCTLICWLCLMVHPVSVDCVYWSILYLLTVFTGPPYICMLYTQVTSSNGCYRPALVRCSYFFSGHCWRRSCRSWRRVRVWNWPEWRSGTRACT